MAMEYGLAPPQPAAVASAAVQRALASRAPTASSSYTAHCVSQGQSSRKALPLMEEGAEAVWVVVAKVVVAEDHEPGVIRQLLVHRLPPQKEKGIGGRHPKPPNERPPKPTKKRKRRNGGRPNPKEREAAGAWLGPARGVEAARARAGPRRQKESGKREESRKRREKKREQKSKKRRKKREEEKKRVRGEEKRE